MAVRRSPRIKELHVRRRDLSLRMLAEKAAIKIQTLEDELSASRAENVALSKKLKEALEARADDAAGPMDDAAGPMAKPAAAPANATTVEPLPDTWASKVFDFIQGHVPDASHKEYWRVNDEGTKGAWMWDYLHKCALVLINTHHGGRNPDVMFWLSQASMSDECYVRPRVGYF